MRSFLLGCFSVVFALCCVGFVVLQFGLYPVNADTEPSWIETKLAHWAVDSHVEKKAKELPENPMKPTDAVLMEGLKSFKSNCSGCHGSPSNKEGLFGHAFFPKAPQFGLKGLDDDARELFWITKHGIRMSGMPAFGGLMKDDEIWKVVTFIEHIPKLPPPVQAEWVKPDQAL